MSPEVRVLIVDDSAFMRKVLTSLLESDPAIRVVGTASDGQSAVAKVRELAPDVITLDIEMPVLDGFGALRLIMQERPTPVVMVSSVTQESTEATIRALALGAFDFVAKPSGSVSLNMYITREELVRKVKAAVHARPRYQRLLPDLPTVKSIGRRETEAGRKPDPDWLVVIGCSTGGPTALHQIVPQLPAHLPAAYMVVQHMPPGFTRSLATRLDGISAVRVKEAEAGDRLTAGEVLIAPGGLHLLLGAQGLVELSDAPPAHGVRPAVDNTLTSIVPRWGTRTIGVILTGMGFDGARGMMQLKRQGGRTIAEHQSSCVVYGMPRAVVELGIADHVLPLHEIPQAIIRLVQDG